VYDKTMPHAVFIVRALDHVIQEFDKSELFARWVGLKQYQGVDYQAKIVHQSLTPEGYAELPSLAASISSSILPGFMAILQGTEQGLNLEFLTTILMFHRKFKHFDTNSSSSSTVSSASSDSSEGGKTRKDMIEEAKRIFTRFLEKGEMYCDPGLVTEIRNLVTKGSGKGVHPAMFRKAGAFIYHRSEHTWCREARATYDWVGRSYDNRSKITRDIEEEFSLKNLPENFDLQIVPSVDDIYSNQELFKDYIAYVDEHADGAFTQFLVAFREYFASPVHSRKSALDKILKAFSDTAKTFPVMGQVSEGISKEICNREQVPDSIVYTLIGLCARAGAGEFYKKWIVEHSMVWKATDWSSAAAAKVSDLSLIMGMSTVETKIEEESLKGKSGFSRYLAKRQMKKQSIAYVRAANAGSASKKKANSQNGAFDMMTMMDPSKSLEKKLSEHTVPSISNTLSSLYLREQFQRIHLDTALDTTGMSLWEAFFKFYQKYVSMSNEDLCDAQENMRKDIIELCDKYKAVIPKSNDVKERAEKMKIVFPHFFRPVEMEIYGKLHEEYEALLRKNGWK